MPKFTYWVRLSVYLFLFGFVGYFNDLAIPDGNLVQRNLAPKQKLHPFWSGVLATRNCTD